MRGRNRVGAYLHPRVTAVGPTERYLSPPRTHNANGEVRAVGLELEIGGVALETALVVVQRALGGTVMQESATQGAVRGTPFGTFAVEFDSRPLQERKWLRPLEAVGVEPDSAAAQAVEDRVLRVASELVPVEVVSPPIPWDRLHDLDPLWDALRAADAEDTYSSLLYAFGLHLNPETPDASAGTVLAHLRAYLLLEPWLTEMIGVDFARRVAPYIRPFPRAYRDLVLAPDYDPDWPELAADYVSYNPTRNRPLDLVPLIVHATGYDLSASVKEWQLIKPRPAYHYRLPNCEITQSGWTPAIDWNRWVQVERLAAAPELALQLCAEYVRAAPGLGETRRWLEHLDARLQLSRAEGTHAPA